MSQRQVKKHKECYAHVDPRPCYLMVGPPTVLLGVLSDNLLWRDGGQLRLLFGTKAACYVVIVLLTISYFVPAPNVILFRGPSSRAVRRRNPQQAAGQCSRIELGANAAQM